MTYVKKEWKNYPDTSTSIYAEDLNRIEDGIEEVSTLATEIDERTENTNYIQATAGANGDFYIDLKDTNLFEGRRLLISFPSAINSNSNARLSVDNGNTYINIKTTYNKQIIAKHIQNKNFELSYNGNYLVCEELDVLYTCFYVYMGSDISTDTNSTIVLNQKYYDFGDNFNTTNHRLTVPVSGIYRINSQIAVLSPNDQSRYGYRISVNGSSTGDNPTVRAQSSGTQAFYVNLTVDIYLNQGDYISMIAQMDNTKDLAGSRGFTFMNGSLLTKVNL